VSEGAFAMRIRTAREELLRAVRERRRGIERRQRLLAVAVERRRRDRRGGSA
jgi:hypothetical protein